MPQTTINGFVAGIVMALIVAILMGITYLIGYQNGKGDVENEVIARGYGYYSSNHPTAKLIWDSRIWERLKQMPAEQE